MRYCLVVLFCIMVVAQFKFKEAFQLVGRQQFFLVGEITRGQIKQGDFMDLIRLGLHKKLQIELIEFVLKWENGVPREEVALGTSELSEDEKQYLKNLGSAEIAINVINKRDNVTAPLFNSAHYFICKLICS